MMSLETGHNEKATDEQIWPIIDAIARNESVTRACEQKGVVSEPTFYRIIFTNEVWLKRYENAKAVDAEKRINKAKEINDLMIELAFPKNGPSMVGPTQVAAAKQYTETMKWNIEVFRPKKYGRHKQEDEKKVSVTLDLPQLNDELKAVREEIRAIKNDV